MLNIILIDYLEMFLILTIPNDINSFIIEIFLFKHYVAPTIFDSHIIRTHNTVFVL